MSLIMFLTKVRFAENGCWEWTGTLCQGYGRFYKDSKWHQAHRWLWKRLKQKTIRKGYHLDHLCRNRCCVNPEHLEPVTPKENVRRGLVAMPGPPDERTHCMRGHELTGDNLRVTPNNRKRCRMCARAAGRKFYRKHNPGCIDTSGRY